MKNPLCNEFRRMLARPDFYIATLLLLAAEVAANIGELQAASLSAVEILNETFVGTGSAQVILLILPILPYALTYAMDEQDRAVLYWTSRQTIGEYTGLRFFTACAGAFLSLGLSVALFLGIAMLRGISFAPDAGSAAVGQLGYSMLLPRHPVGFFLLFLIDRGCTAAMTAGCAMMLSGFIPSIYFAAPGPMCLYYLALRLASERRVSFALLLPTTWVEGYYELERWNRMLLVKAAVTTGVCTLFGLLFYICVRHRWRK